MTRYTLFVGTLLLVGCASDDTQYAFARNDQVSSNPITSKEQVPNCDRVDDHVSLRRCKVLERDRADRELDDQFSVTLQRLKQVNSEDLSIAQVGGFASDEYRGEQKKFETSLVRSQESWMIYRKEYCNVSRFPGRGGNSNLENLIGCELPLIQARIEQLRILTKNLESGG